MIDKYAKGVFERRHCTKDAVTVCWRCGSARDLFPGGLCPTCHDRARFVPYFNVHCWHEKLKFDNGVAIEQTTRNYEGRFQESGHDPL